LSYKTKHSLNKYLISIVGPTAIGKTSLSIAIAEAFDTEVLSCDSRQFYKEMSIGTAVPPKEELARVKHHFIQNRSIHEDYSVGDFERDAIIKINEFFKNHFTLVMVGGSGLYVDAVLKGLDYFPDINPKIREELNTVLQKDGLLNLQAQLEYLDPESYESIDIQNPHRVIRALEVCLGSEHPFSYYKNQPKQKRDFIPIKIGLDADREIIYQRIEQRVDIMLQEGLLEEAKTLYHNKDLNALQTVGYRELFNYFDGEYDLDFAISEIKKNTRRFAKRQNTWFKKDQEITWFDYQTSYGSIVDFIMSRIQI